MRGGVCRHEERRIDLSVSFCQRATRAEIEDTLLHEIAHAIVGYEHRHDDVWKAKAREIGCTAERCHQVTHTVARWVRNGDRPAAAGTRCAAHVPAR